MASIVTSDDDGRTPVLLVTDIGADLDDTLAFLTIAGSPALRLVGVVTSVGDGAWSLVGVVVVQQVTVSHSVLVQACLSKSFLLIMSSRLLMSCFASSLAFA